MDRPPPPARRVESQTQIPVVPSKHTHTPRIERERERERCWSSPVITLVKHRAPSYDIHSYPSCCWGKSGDSSIGAGTPVGADMDEICSPVLKIGRKYVSCCRCALNSRTAATLALRARIQAEYNRRRITLFLMLTKSLFLWISQAWTSGLDGLAKGAAARQDWWKHLLPLFITTSGV